MLSMRVCFYQCIAYRQIRYTITEDIMTKKTVRNTKKNDRKYKGARLHLAHRYGNQILIPLFP